jgi:Tol biopolymer transport system component
MGIGSNFEPAARGAPNQLTARITNVNNLPLTYHWSVEAGTLTDSTQATATWTPPDTVATFNVTVSIEARDGDAYYFKTLTVPMSVDNQFIRWTRSDQIQFDPAPTPGGVLYAGYRNPTTGSSDLYRIDTPLGAPAQLTSGFFSASAPSPRADGVDFAFAAKKISTEASPSIYLLPFGGGDTAAARLVAARHSRQTYLATPRFPRMGTRLAYVSDSITPNLAGQYVIHWKIGADLNLGPTTVTPSFGTYLTGPSWGRDGNGDGQPDSIMTLGIDDVGSFAETVNGIYVFPTPDAGRATTFSVWLRGAQIQTPDWSPNEQYVAFAMKNAGTNERDIWIINRAAANISAAVRVTSGPADDSQPRFSDDGNTIFFVSNRVDRYGAGGIQGIERRGRNIWGVAQFDRP